MAGTMTQGQDRPERQDVGARLTRGARDYWMVLRRHRVILFVTMATTMMHAMTTKAVDLVLAMLLLIGSVTGAQIGTRISMTLRPEYLRILLAAIVLLVAARMALGLGWRPDEIFTIEVR